MTPGPARLTYTVQPAGRDFRPGDPAAPWADLTVLSVGHYLWLDNGYRPKVEARLGWSPVFLYVRFEVAERRIRVRYTKFQDPVYKDSCVEFFVDMFPKKRLGYVNFETNAAGTLLAAFGPDRSHRTPLWPEDLAGFDAVEKNAVLTIVTDSKGTRGIRIERCRYHNNAAAGHIVWDTDGYWKGCPERLDDFLANFTGVEGYQGNVYSDKWLFDYLASKGIAYKDIEEMYERLDIRKIPKWFDRAGYGALIKKALPEPTK